MSRVLTIFLSSKKARSQTQSVVVKPCYRIRPSLLHVLTPAEQKVITTRERRRPAGKKFSSLARGCVFPGEGDTFNLVHLYFLQPQRKGAGAVVLFILQSRISFLSFFALQRCTDPEVLQSKCYELTLFSRVYLSITTIISISSSSNSLYHSTTEQTDPNHFIYFSRLFFSNFDITVSLSFFFLTAP